MGGRRYSGDGRGPAHKQLYLNVPFFLIRAALYFAGWILFSYLEQVVARAG